MTDNKSVYCQYCGYVYPYHDNLCIIKAVEQMEEEIKQLKIEVETQKRLRSRLLRNLYGGNSK